MGGAIQSCYYSESHSHVLRTWKDVILVHAKSTECAVNSHTAS
jgi:hypothetical protein